MNRDALIRTKLQRPAIGADILPRTQLIERLENGIDRKLTLFSAPAGYGKSILASLWAEACSCPVAWLSLDKKDNEPGVFLTYFINAMRTIFPASFQETEELLAGQQLPALDTIVSYLVNEVDALSQRFMIVLDDYHEISNQQVNELVSNLIRYLPDHAHLVIVTRQDPLLDIASLRVKKQMNEIRLAELRFDEVEAAQVLRAALGKDLTPRVAREIFKRTEGWAAGLRLVVLALRNDDDHERFIETFHGTNQQSMSYLLHEVLSRQPRSLQTFLLQTSLFDRFSADLCDAVCQVDEAKGGSNQDILKSLVDGNLFINPLDQQREWFRYHPLFQGLLRHQLELQFTKPAVEQLHRRASSWFAGQGLLDEALDHALLAGDINLAADVVSAARFGLMHQTRWQRLEQLLQRFPQDFINNHPDLLIAEMWLHYQKSQLRKLPAGFERLEELINQRADEEQDYRYLVGEMSALRSLLLYHTMDIDGVIANAQQALRLTAPELGVVRVLARLMLAGTQQIAGDLNGAYATIYSGFDEEPYQSDALRATVLVTACFLGWVTADLQKMGLNAAQAVNLAQKAHLPGMLGYGHYFLGVAAYHQNDLAAAEAHLSFVNKRPYTTYDDSFVHSACGLALTYQALGKEKEAFDVVEAALAYLLVTGNSDLLPVMQAIQAELALRQEKLSAASQWANQLNPLPPLSPMTQFYAPHLTLAKVWLAENTVASVQLASDLLAELKTFLESTHNNVHLIQTLALLAISQQMSGDESAALRTIEQALILALPGDFIRVFVDLGPQLEQLIARLTIEERELADYRSRILAAAAPANGEQRVLAQEYVKTLVDPLTDREMDVLILLSQRQTGKEIAEQLSISPYTVRSHTKNIYAKLDVHNRRQAAHRAKELGLVGPE